MIPTPADEYRESKFGQVFSVSGPVVVAYARSLILRILRRLMEGAAGSRERGVEEQGADDASFLWCHFCREHMAGAAMYELVRVGHDECVGSLSVACDVDRDGYPKHVRS